MKYQFTRAACPAALMSALMVFASGCATQQTTPTITSTPVAQVQPAVAAVPKSTELSAVIDPKAMDAIRNMGGFLRTLKAYHVNFKIAVDEVLKSGQKVMVDGSAELTVQTPKHLHFSTKIEEAQRDLQFFFDGKTFTIFGNTHKFYASVPAPNTIHELLDLAEARYNINFPFRDLFVWGTDKADEAGIKSAIYIGPTKVDGILCDHFAFRNVHVDWQIWISQGKTPLPRKLVITTLDQEQHPQYISEMNWNLSPKINSKSFTFVPPRDAHKIDLATVEVANVNPK